VKKNHACFLHLHQCEVMFACLFVRLPSYVGSSSLLSFQRPSSKVAHCHVHIILMLFRMESKHELLFDAIDLL